MYGFLPFFSSLIFSDKPTCNKKEVPKTECECECEDDGCPCSTCAQKRKVEVVQETQQQVISDGNTQTQTQTLTNDDIRTKCQVGMRDARIANIRKKVRNHTLTPTLTPTQFYP